MTRRWHWITWTPATAFRLRHGAHFAALARDLLMVARMRGYLTIMEDEV